MFPPQESPRRPRLSAVAGWSLFAGVTLLVGALLTLEFAVEFGLAAQPQYVAAEDPFLLQEHNPTYSSTYDDGKVVYGTQTHAPIDAVDAREPAYAPIRDRMQANRAERRGSRSEVPFMQRGPARRVIAWLGTGAWRLLRPRGVFVRLLPADSVRLHGFFVAVAHA